jgi:hypothetical protein
MPKSRLVLLDANILIQLFELKIWPRLIERFEIIVAETVLAEADFFFEDGAAVKIDLRPDIESRRIRIVSVDTAAVQVFLARFEPNYLEKLDPGEAESLAYVVSNNDGSLICSADRIVFRALGNLSLKERGISLEEILQQCGLSRTLASQFTKAFREHWTRRGTQEHFKGLGAVRSAAAPTKRGW